MSLNEDGGGRRSRVELLFVPAADPAAVDEPPRPGHLPHWLQWVPADAFHVAGWRRPGEVYG